MANPAACSSATGPLASEYAPSLELIEVEVIAPDDHTLGRVRPPSSAMARTRRAIEARSFGPMLVAGELGDFWLYILAPLVGGLIAAFAGDFLLKAFTPEEDEDNGGDVVDDAGDLRITVRSRSPGS